jgi:hypothetical protein
MCTRIMTNLRLEHEANNRCFASTIRQHCLSPILTISVQRTSLQGLGLQESGTATSAQGQVTALDTARSHLVSNHAVLLE